MDMEDNNLLGFTSPGADGADNGGAPSPDANAMAGGYVDPFAGVAVKDNSYTGGGMSIPEVTALREWESKHEGELEEKSKAEQNIKNERRAAAEKEIKEWNEERLANVAKKSATNRKDEQTMAAANKEKPQGANAWERVADLIDTSARSAEDCRDVSRMRALLIQLKATPPAKAA